MLKKLAVLGFAATFVSNVAAKELVSFDDMVAAIKQGQKLTLVVDWEKCQSNYPEVKLDYLASWTPESYVVKKGNFIASRGMSYTHSLIVADKDLGPINQAYEYFIFKDKGMVITNRFIDPATNTEKVPAAKLTCSSADSFHIYS